MNYFSTRRTAPASSFRNAVMHGLAPDGGLYLPCEIPELPPICLDSSVDLTYPELAFRLARLFCGGDPDDTELADICADAFNFAVPITPVGPKMNALELFWGPTFAFKDFGARFLARVMNHYASAGSRRLTILVATSGDTGSAVADGFSGMDAIDVVLLYPSGRVSHLQEQQLTTIGGNVTALEVDGAFDDCQAMVKAVFADPEIHARRPVSSANSINIGRLLPQAFYAVHPHRMLAQGHQSMVYCVPSGNFGNICSALIAQLMGLPISRLVIGTNANDVVPEYLSSGEMVPRPAVETPASAMDVGNPSNFERIHTLLDGDHGRAREVFWASKVETDEILETIHQVRRDHGVMLDPHSAVGHTALDRFISTEGGIGQPACFAATAHPGKFAEAIEQATGEQVEIPEALRQALDRPKNALRFSNRPEELREFLIDTA